MVTAQQLVERITELESQRETHIGNANACNGAIAECRRLIATFQPTLTLDEAPKE